MNIVYEVKEMKSTSDLHSFIVDDKEYRLISLFNTLKKANKNYIIDLVRSLTFHDPENADIAFQWSALAMNAGSTTFITRQRITNIEYFPSDGGASCNDIVYMSSSFKVNVLVGISTVFAFSGYHPLPRYLARAAAKKVILMTTH
ncbi:hypothetical protein [Acidithiobacillus sp.]